MKDACDPKELFRQVYTDSDEDCVITLLYSGKKNEKGDTIYHQVKCIYCFLLDEDTDELDFYTEIVQLRTQELCKKFIADFDEYDIKKFLERREAEFPPINKELLLKAGLGVIVGQALYDQVAKPQLDKMVNTKYLGEMQLKIISQMIYCPNYYMEKYTDEQLNTVSIEFRDQDNIECSFPHQFLKALLKRNILVEVENIRPALGIQIQRYKLNPEATDTLQQMIETINPIQPNGCA